MFQTHHCNIAEFSSHLSNPLHFLLQVAGPNLTYFLAMIHSGCGHSVTLRCTASKPKKHSPGDILMKLQSLVPSFYLEERKKNNHTTIRTIYIKSLYCHYTINKKAIDKISNMQIHTVQTQGNLRQLKCAIENKCAKNVVQMLENMLNAKYIQHLHTKLSCPIKNEHVVIKA